MFLQAIQRRVNGEETFNRNWTEYKLGFGTPYGDYWIGKELILHLITQWRIHRGGDESPPFENEKIKCGI